MNLKRDTYAIVNLDHLKYNVELAHEKFKRPLMAVIKADAYGHGYREVASFLKDIDYIEMFAVATLPEAIELRELGIKKGILILGAIPTSKEDIDLAIQYDISLTMVSVDYLKLLDKLVDEFLNMESPTKEIIREFIERIEIHSDKQVDIYFNFKPLQDLNEDLNSFCVAKKEYERKAV